MRPNHLDVDRLRLDTTSLSCLSPRLGGAPGEAIARDWVTDQFRAVGLDRVHHQRIFYPRWIGSGRLSVDGRELPALALHGSASTPRAGLTAPLLDLGAGTAEDYARCSPADLRGKIHFAEAGVIYRRRTVLRAEKSRAAGVILANPVGAEIEAGTAQIFGRIPIFAVSRETGAALREAARRGAEMNLAVESRYVIGRCANVVGEICGARREYIQLAAHYDAWYSGAADNAAGVATLLELARCWRGQHFPLTLRFVSFAAEEEGLMGSLFDVVTRWPTVKALCRGVVSPDIVGPRTEGLYISGGPAVARAMAAEAAREIGYTGAAIRDFPETTFGDHWPYTRLGIPGLMFSKMPYPHYHTPNDTPAQIDWDEVRWMTAIVGRVVEKWMGGGR
ncbi:MAG: M28 family peptidase [Chloroflexi bacterium]|nr:M28 family peptidase [Chloroflexota bacterium]